MKLSEATSFWNARRAPHTGLRYAWIAGVKVVMIIKSTSIASSETMTLTTTHAHKRSFGSSASRSVMGISATRICSANAISPLITPDVRIDMMSAHEMKPIASGGPLTRTRRSVPSRCAARIASAISSCRGSP